MSQQFEKLNEIVNRLGRRRFTSLGLASAATPILLSLLNSCSQSGQQANSAVREIKFSHGFGLCNLPLFYSVEKQLFQKYGLKGTTVMSAAGGDQATQLAAGQVDMGVIPFTNAIAAYTQGAPFQVVAGSGIKGLFLISKPEIKSIEQLKGKKVGTIQADTLEVIVYDYLQRANMTYQDVEMVYIADPTESINAYLAGKLDALSTIEPYATKAKTLSKGNVLGNGTDIYGEGFPDCILAVRKEIIQKEPEVVKNVVKTFFAAQYQIEQDFKLAAEATIDKYYKTDMNSLLSSAKAQPPGVDIRNKRDFMFARAKSMKELNYINQDPDENFVNFSLLEAVIKEEPQLWERVKVKSA